MRYCCVFKCPNRVGGKGAKLFSLPQGNSNAERAKLWIRNIGQKGLPRRLSICERHFTDDQLELNRQDGNIKLRWNAVPTVFENRIIPNTTTLSPKISLDDGVEVVEELDGMNEEAVDNGVELVEELEDRNEEALDDEVELVEELEDRGEEAFDDEVEQIEEFEGGNEAFDDGVESVKELEGGNEVFDDEVEPMEELEDRGEEAFEGREDEQDEETDLKSELEALQRKNCQLEQEIRDYKSLFSTLLNTDQITFLHNNSMQFNDWSDDTINKALRLYLSCGEKGYEEIRKQIPYPCFQTLKQQISMFRLTPGVLNNTFQLLKGKVKSLKVEERYATVYVDEMSVSPALEFDRSILEIIGKPTLSLSGSERSCEKLSALVFMLASVTASWKQIVGYEFTGSSHDAGEMKHKVFDLIKKCNEIGITVRAVVSVTGKESHSFKRLFYVGATQPGKVVNSCSHPCNNGELFFVCDPHLLKVCRKCTH